jgi:outer membrane protein
MKKGIITIIAGFLSMSSYAQDTLVLTYDEAVKIALQKNVTLNQEKNNLVTSLVQRNSSAMAFAPGVSIDGGGTRAKGPQQNPENGNLEDFTNDSFNASLSASITIFNGFRNYHILGQARNNLKAQSSNVQRTEQVVIFNVTNQYLQVLLDQELVRIARENMAVQKALFDQIRESVNVGARAEADLYNQDALLKGQEVLWLNSKVTLENDLATLAQSLQLEPTQIFKVQLPEINKNFLNVADMSVDSLYSIALQNRKDLQQLEYRVDANQAAYRAASSGYLPRITAFAAYGSNYYSNLRADPLYGNFSSQFFDVLPSSAIGFNFSIPLYDRSVTRYNRIFNRVQRDNSKLSYENLKKSIMIEVRRSYNNYISAIQNYKASQAQFQAGDLAFKTQRESFLLGVSNQVALAQASQTFVQGAASLAQAEVTLYFQKALLDYALGTLNVNDIQ